MGVEKKLGVLILSVMFLFVVSGVVSAIQVDTSCPFQQQEGRVIADFGGQLLISNGGSGDAQTEPVVVSIPSGYYDISLYSYDGPKDRNVSQPNESYKILLQDGSYVTIDESSSTPDLADFIDFAEFSGVVDSSFYIPSGVESVQGYHSVYPDESSANSLMAGCVAFDPVPECTINSDCEDLNDQCGQGYCELKTGSCEYFKFPDETGPVTSDLNASKVVDSCQIRIEALETEDCSLVSKAEYFLGGATCPDKDTRGIPLDPADGEYDEIIEAVRKSGVPTTDGSVNVHVRARNDVNVWGPCETVRIDVDCLPPDYPTCEFGDTQNELGIALDSVCNANHTLVCDNDPLLTANICDAESRIQLAEYFLNEKNPINWQGIFMDASDGVFDEQCEDVEAVIDLDELSEGTHYVQLHGKDGQENWGKFAFSPIISFIKDTLAPETDKEISFNGSYDGCNYREAMGEVLTNGCYYVRSGTQIGLSAIDPDPQQTDEHAGNVVINYNIYYSEDCTADQPNWVLQNSGQGAIDESVSLALEEDSCHLIEYWSTDGCGWEEEHHWELDIVDNKAPLPSKVHGEPLVIKDLNNDTIHYVTPETPITINCEDQQPHPIGYETLYWRYSYHPEGFDGPVDYSDWYSDDELPVDIHFREDSWHNLEYYCEDGLGNKGETHVQYYVVESQPPEIEKEVIGPQEGQCPPEPLYYGEYFGSDHQYEYEYNHESDLCYIDNATIIEVDAEDPEPHPVGDVSCRYWYYVFEDWEDYHDSKYKPARYPNSGVYRTLPIQFPEESIHELHLVCEDALGNANYDVEKFVVDHSPPTIWKGYEGPYYDEVYGVLDASCVDEMESYCEQNWNGSWNSYEECVEYYIDDECSYNSVWSEWINSETEVVFGARDVSPHPSGMNSIEYRVTLVDDSYCVYPSQPEESYCDAEGSGEWTSGDWEEDSFYMEEDSCHLIEIKATDNVNKTSVHKQCVFVDNKEPETNKVLGEPKYLCEDGEEKCGPETPWTPYYVTSNTPLTLTCEDQLPHPVGNEALCYRISWHGISEFECEEEHEGWYDLETDTCYLTDEYSDYDGYWSQDEEYYCVYADDFENNEFEFNFQEDSLHNLEWFCEDALGNNGGLNIEYDNVDNRGPEITIHNPTEDEAEEVLRCAQSIVVSVEDEKSGADETSVYAELWNESEDLVRTVQLTKSVYGTYEGLMDKSLPAGEYLLVVKASDNLGNEGSENLLENLNETVFVEYVSPATCNIDPELGGTCDFEYHLCMRGENSVQFWMNKLGDIITPAMMNGTISNNGDSTFVGLKHEGFESPAGELLLGEECVEINGKTYFNLHLDLDSNVTSQIGAGVHDLEYWIKSDLVHDCGQQPVD